MAEERFVMVGDTKIPIMDDVKWGVILPDEPLTSAEAAVMLRSALGERIAGGTWGPGSFGYPSDDEDEVVP